MKRLRFTLLLAGVLALAACARLTESNLEKVHNGMTSAEVKGILGDPTSSETSSLLGISGTTYTYHTDKSDVKIIFVDDKVTLVQGNFQ